MEIIQEYKTSDIVLASYLCLEGHEVAEIECVGNKGTFVFHQIPQDLIIKFDLGSARVEPISFNTAIRRLTTAVKRHIGS
jgi:hypothetical protein